MNSIIQEGQIDIPIAIFLASVTGFVVWYLQYRIETIRKEKERFHEDRRKVYLTILDPFINMLSSPDLKSMIQNAKKLSEQPYKKEIFELKLIGSDDVVRSLNNLLEYYGKNYSKEQRHNCEKNEELFGSLFLAVRKDLGNGNTKLKPLDMLLGIPTTVKSWHRK